MPEVVRSRQIPLQTLHRNTVRETHHATALAFTESTDVRVSNGGESSHHPVLHIPLRLFVSNLHSAVQAVLLT